MIVSMMCGVVVGVGVGSAQVGNLPHAGGSQPQAALDWRALETTLADHVQLTFPDRFMRAGEAYFDHSVPPRLVIFQGTERPPAPKEGEAPAVVSPHYGMYIARLVYDGDKPVAIGQITRISPEGSANTCGWFHPTEPAAFLYASTLVPPRSETAPGFQRTRGGTSRYRWDFPAEMTIVGQSVRSIPSESMADLLKDDPKWTPIDPNWRAAVEASGKPSVNVMLKDPPRLIESLPDGAKEGYAAECSFDGTGRHVLYTFVRPVEAKDGGGGAGEAPAVRGDPDIFVWDTKTKQNVSIVRAPGYDGGPFFSPDGRWICYRSDRRGDNNLQLFIGELAFDDASDPGRITGLKREIQITNDAEVVNWAPFWHPSGAYLVYASSAVAHFNYEVYAIDVSAWTKPGMPLPSTPAPRVRITHASGFDGLPAFSTDGQYMLITSQRGGRFGSEERPTSQLWLARVASKPDFSKPEPLPKQFDAAKP